ncbi:tail protein X [Duganella sp. sic0402]|uniref:LysM peptidoglycan-binding domain-containing protein n=1 Tax=Duganella sp. sic0402 TaxID=2854786 RepID=UPI001C48AED9|nr:tail protein X [Duganella sp. sic0402]MBV7534715.1 tail protein X [Duganella sp. sic0402]
MAGSLKHMRIDAYDKPDFSSVVDTLEVWINPASYTHDYGIKHNNRQAQGSSGASPSFNRVCQETVAFDLIVDATGVMPTPDSTANGVTDVIDHFKRMTVNVQGAIHQPKYLKLTWAQLQFQCVLSKLNVAYTLFRPDGTPLRAKLSVTFISFATEVVLAKKANLQSPDMTHLVTVFAGDTLPGLCYRIYGDSQYYLRVAQSNGLADFRQLLPGTQLAFPPLAGGAA